LAYASADVLALPVEGRFNLISTMAIAGAFNDFSEMPGGCGLVNGSAQRLGLRDKCSPLFSGEGSRKLIADAVGQLDGNYVVDLSNLNISPIGKGKDGRDPDHLPIFLDQLTQWQPPSFL
jgi:hypothetical protein